jgi:hypothetical protein
VENVVVMRMRVALRNIKSSVIILEKTIVTTKAIPDRKAVLLT